MPGIKESTQKACNVEYKGKEYTSFCNDASLVLTSEKHSGIDLVEHPETYYRVDRLLADYNGEMTLNFSRVIEEAKAKGYKLLKKEFKEHNYLIKIKDNYYKVALLDISMSIIDTGNDFDIYCDRKGLLYFYNDIGMGILTPFRVCDDFLKTVTVIDLNKED